jgi:hypothetical protein
MRYEIEFLRRMMAIPPRPSRKALRMAHASSSVMVFHAGRKALELVRSDVRR